MRDCFPSAAARIFTCKGELVLDGESLTFISPWRTSIEIPLKSIEDLSIGQFQMWTTPWVMKYARLNFLSVSFHRDGELQTVHLTPVPRDASSAAQINLYVGRWFERLQQVIREQLGSIPRASDPEWLSISAEPAWNRKGLPLAYGFGLTSLAAWILMPQRSVPIQFSAPVFLLSILLLIGMLWFCLGFLRANRALWRGDLEAVTSDEPPKGETANAVPKAPSRNRRKRFRWLNLSFLGAVGAGLMVPIGMLLWEAWVFPSFGERIFGKRSPSTSASKLILDAIPLQYGEGSHDARQYGGQVWNFKCLVPSDHQAQILFVRFTNGVPVLEPGLSAYFKTGHTPAGIDLFVSCEPQQHSVTPGSTNFLWNVNLGLGATNAKLIPAQTPFRLFDTPARISVLSGHQRTIRLLGYSELPGKSNSAREGVELRVLLEPLKSPALRTVPSEIELGNCIVGSGFELPTEDMLRLINRMPMDQ